MSTSAVSVPHALYAWFAPGDPAQSILPFVPRPLKWFLLLVLLINARSLPLLWTIRVFRPAVYAHLRFRFWRLFDSPARRRARIRDMSCVGVDPFVPETVYTTRATPDVSDFNWHLSNSSYAMSYDMARFKFFVHHMPLLFSDGGWVALGATHYSFTREIPLNSEFQVRVSFASWDHKWVYMVARYVTFPSKATKRKSADRNSANRSALALPPTVTPIHSATPSPSRSPAPTVEPIGIPLPAGATLHCTAVSRLCFKIGRITIPPAVALAASGFGVSRERYEEILDWRLQNRGARIKKFYSGGWRDVPEGERWWEEGLGGEIERKRGEGLRGLAESVGLPTPGL